MSKWLFIGSSPSAPAGLAVAREHEYDHIITCNGGIKLWPVPTHYFLWDAIAADSYRGLARHAGMRGTRLLTLDVPAEQLRAHGLEFVAGRVPVMSGEPTVESWGSFAGSGMVCMEYALRHGAQTLSLVGCDGYIHDGGEDYFDGREVSRLYGRYRDGIYNAVTVGFVQPRIQRLVDLWPAVRWTIYGSPHYRIGGDTWHQIPL